MDERANELNELMQDRFGFNLREEFRHQPVTNETLRQARTQLLAAIAVGLAAATSPTPQPATEEA